MKFLQQILASAIGFLVAVFLISLLAMSAMATLVLLGTSQASGPLEPHSVLELTFDSNVPERTPDDALSLVGRMGLSEDVVGLNDMLWTIYDAAENDLIDGIYLHTDALTPAPLATLSEIRRALQYFRSTGKFIVSYSASYTQKGYYMATAADEIYLHPAGSLQLTGLRAETLFYKDALDKLGVEIQVVRQGAFKSAVEPYLDNRMSEENRAQTSRYISLLWQQMLSEICDARNLQPEALTRAVASMRVSLPADALAAGLVDSLAHTDQVMDRLVSLTGARDEDDLHLVTLRDYLMLAESETTAPMLSRQPATDCIAVVYAEGDIVDGGGMNTLRLITPEDMRDALRQAREDTTVKAVVFRINSGGGSALASDKIWREVALTAATKPVVASLGAVAASGGYYVVAPATRIVASPYTLTGSIGVFFLLPSVQKLLNDHLGIYSETVESVPHASRLSMLRPLPAEEREALEREVAFTYRTFVEKVADGRHKTTEDVLALAEGRVWAASDAAAAGLVDTLGTFDDAIALAMRLGHCADDYEIWELPEPRDWFSQLRATFQVRMQARTLCRHGLEPLWQTWRRMQVLTRLQGPCAMLPYQLELY